MKKEEGMCFCACHYFECKIKEQGTQDYMFKLGMANQEHKELSQFIKEVHNTLRKSTLTLGIENAWYQHCKNENILLKYAQCMEKLATTYWETNCNKDSSQATSRIKWVVNICFNYFIDKTYLEYRTKEINISHKINLHLNNTEMFSKPLKLLDVGSCYNPFNSYDIFDVLAIDLYPANSSVLQCDFLHVPVRSENNIVNLNVECLQQNSFDVVVFCFLLEYLPTSDLRVEACQKAYNLLKYGGLLVINTPDSKHVGANCKIMKCWRYTLALMGYSRIKYEKFKHMHCMAFRKSLNKNIAVRWAELHQETYMEYSIHIPQDFHRDNVLYSGSINKDTIVEDFKELPFY